MNVAWYAAYGSNTDETRFARYLARCTTAARAADSRRLLIDLPLYFAGESRTWGGGGVAFTSTVRDGTPETLARAWLLPVPHIAEIGAMENRRPAADGVLDVDAVVDAGVLPTFDGWYDAWVHCGELDGIPVVTLTSSTEHERTTPGQAYGAVVARGLRTTHQLTAEETAIYLAPRAGVPEDVVMAWQSAGAGHPDAE